jgi:hypothetical protein
MYQFSLDLKILKNFHSHFLKKNIVVASAGMAEWLLYLLLRPLT